MCELNTKHAGKPASDVIYNNIPLNICSDCITAIKIKNSAHDSLMDFTTGWDYLKSEKLPA